MSEAAFEDLQGRSLDGELRIAITDYYRPHDIARILKTFSEQHPRLRLHVTVLPSAVIDSAAGDDASFDIGLSLRLVTGNTRASSRRGDAKSTVVRREKLLWVSAADAAPRSAAPYRLVLLPTSCHLQRFRREAARRKQGVLCDIAFGIRRRRIATRVEGRARHLVSE